jgi:imidazoleglycerol-phosphate dehydratase
MAEQRIVSLTRKTAETDIALTINLDGTGKYEVDTGIPFFDHMLCLFAKHGLFDLKLKAVGDLEVDYHHTVEDVGIVLGDAVKKALGDKLGIRRYGFFILPMDESLARVVMDLSNRPFLKYEVDSPSNYIRDFNIVLIREFFQAVVNSLSANIHLKVE